jgi:hypothetical protein
MLPEQIAVTMIVADALEALGVPYAIGGSFASALHGVMRATMDAGLVAHLCQEDVATAEDTVLAKLEWYRRAARRRIVGGATRWEWSRCRAGASTLAICARWLPGWACRICWSVPLTNPSESDLRRKPD